MSDADDDFEMLYDGVLTAPDDRSIPTRGWYCVDHGFVGDTVHLCRKEGCANVRFVAAPHQGQEET